MISPFEIFLSFYIGWNLCAIVFVHLIMCDAGTICLQSIPAVSNSICGCPKGTGKTTAAKVFVSFVGHRQTHLVRQLSEAE